MSNDGKQTWSTGEQIKAAFSDQAPSGAVFYYGNPNASLVITFKEGNGNAIQVMAFTGGGSGFTAITSIPNCKTSAAPGLAVYKNILVCTYVDLTTSNLYYTLYDGSVWSTPSVLVPGVVASATASIFANPFSN